MKMISRSAKALVSRTLSCCNLAKHDLMMAVQDQVWMEATPPPQSVTLGDVSVVSSQHTAVEVEETLQRHTSCCCCCCCVAEHGRSQECDNLQDKASASTLHHTTMYAEAHF